jgi:2-polyprenyl-3-methyl-5-hydroxy-6-metoxy-1,4-benzoquinol methylase
VPAPCPVCEATRFRARFAQHDVALESCTGCGFVRRSRPPDAAALRARYLEDRQHGELAWQEHARNLERFCDMLARLERFVQPGRFLDVGCSLGTSLVAARARGWEPVGLELSRPCVEFGRKEWGVDIRHATLAEVDLAPRSFRAVFMHHTLEHLDDPAAVVARAFELLEPGGAMYQALPNWDCLKRRLLGRWWSYGVTEDHLVHFGPRTLRRLVARLGFEVCEVRAISYREDPRLLRDLLHRIGLQRWFMKRLGLPPQPFCTKEYLRYVTDTKWAFAVCNRLWPARLVTWLRLGEDLHLIARRPG